MQNQKQGRGCLFYGCLTAVLVFIGVVAGIYFGTRQAVKYAVSRYTSNAPAPVPKLDLPPGEQEAMARAIEQRASEAMRNPNATPLTLGEKELNVLLRQNPDFSSLSNQFYLQPVGTQLQAHVSVPLDQFELWQSVSRRLLSKDLKGRYFNGVAVLQPGVSNGMLTLRIEDLTVNGKSLPADFTARMKHFNLTADATNQPILKRVEDVEVRDGAVKLRLRGDSKPATAN
jgi:hypothetical protein